MSQETKVYDYMKAHGGVTNYDAFEALNITRLSARIFNLRKRGVKINTEWQETKDGIKYARYSLVE